MGSVSDFREREDNHKLGFWCYYLRTNNHTELQCDVIEDDGSITAPRMQLVALIEALKRCKNIGSKDTVKIYATDQQYLELCFQIAAKYHPTNFYSICVPQQGARINQTNFLFFPVRKTHRPSLSAPYLWPLSKCKITNFSVKNIIYFNFIY